MSRYRVVGAQAECEPGSDGPVHNERSISPRMVFLSQQQPSCLSCWRSSSGSNSMRC